MRKEVIKTSLIISTYNWAEALNLCLLSVSRLSVLPDEVIIADDGSRNDTSQLIKRHQKSFKIPLIHVWHKDEGFQLAKIRNKAIAKARYPYIIQVDGDLILHKHFIKDHIQIARKGTFVTGSRVLMNDELSSMMMSTEKTTANIFTPGIRNHFNSMRINFLRNYLADRYHQKDIDSIRGCNMAFWKNDIIKVNGYNEEFEGWGGEDQEIAVRMLNAGIKKRVIKMGGIVLHIAHTKYCRAKHHENDHRMLQTLKEEITYCRQGISQYLNNNRLPRLGNLT